MLNEKSQPPKVTCRMISFICHSWSQKLVWKMEKRLVVAREGVGKEISSCGAKRIAWWLFVMEHRSTHGINCIALNTHTCAHTHVCMHTYKRMNNWWNLNKVGQMSISWLWHCSMVIYDITIGGKLGEGTYNSSVLHFTFIYKSINI